MVDHGGVGRNLGFPCEQSFNLDRAFNTQPHTIVVQVPKKAQSGSDEDPKRCLNRTEMRSWEVFCRKQLTCDPLTPVRSKRIHVMSY